MWNKLFQKKKTIKGKLYAVVISTANVKGRKQNAKEELIIPKIVKEQFIGQAEAIV